MKRVIFCTNFITAVDQFIFCFCFWFMECRYGYLTNTKVKLIMVTTDLDVKDADVRSVCCLPHFCYCYCCLKNTLFGSHRLQLCPLVHGVLVQ